MALLLAEDAYAIVAKVAQAIRLQRILIGSGESEELHFTATIDD